MALRKCAECGNAVSSKAKTCPHCGAPLTQSNSAAGCLLVLMIAGLIYYFVHRSGSSSPSPHQNVVEKPTPRSKRVQNGEIGILRRAPDDQHHLWVGVTKEWYDRAADLAASKDNLGLAKMIMKGQLLDIAPGTKCRVINTGFLTDEVRIMEGAHVGESGFVAHEFIAPE